LEKCELSFGVFKNLSGGCGTQRNIATRRASKVTKAQREIRRRFLRLVRQAHHRQAQDRLRRLFITAEDAEHAEKHRFFRRRFLRQAQDRLR